MAATEGKTLLFFVHNIFKGTELMNVFLNIGMIREIFKKIDPFLEAVFNFKEG